MSQDPSAKTPSKKNLQSIILLILLAIVVVMLIITRSGQNNAQANAEQLLKMQELRIKIEQTEKLLIERGITLPADPNSLIELSKTIANDAEYLRQEVAKLQALENQDADKHHKTELELRAALTTNMKLSEEASQLRSQLSQITVNNQNVATLQQEVTRLSSEVALRDKQIEELSKRPTPQTVAQFRASLNETMLTNENLNKKIAELEAQALTAVDNAEVDKLKLENQEMRAELQRLRADSDYDSLYAKSAEELRPEAALLYADLEKLEGMSPAEVEAAYIRISEEHNAHMVRSVRFKTNSSDVGWSTLTQIKDTISTAPKTSFFLVVGYASKTGNAENNKILSAKRSVTIASIVKHLKGGAGTRAVFLGQTNRFSSQALENQICEVWELRK
ncbi:OmpA family protein [Rubritalea marina]|uniref:OmpA family protein n=1 Tax=Rubritalea marina TaxID=361055 RepID=UPI000373126C|nr:OmpA family protein [Rubritalea marina]